MSVEALPLRRAVKPAPPPNRLLARGPEFYRSSPTAAASGGRKQSAVERLEADKAKYVKSQVALCKQQPVRPPPPARRPLLSPSSAALRPTRRTPPPRPSSRQGGGAPLDLEHLSNLINGVSEAPPSPVVDPEEGHPEDHADSSPCPSPSPAAGGESGEGAAAPRPPSTDWSSPAKVRAKAPGAAKAESPPSGSSPSASTVRRVDVMPLRARPGQPPPGRPQRQIRQPLLQLAAPSHPHFHLHAAAAPHPRLFRPRTTPGPPPLKAVPVPSPPHETTPLSPTEPPALPPAEPPLPPPASPAVTRLSTSSARKRPSLTRSKSDVSDRFSRAGTDLERFFNLCGLDPSELQALTGPASDIVSVARLRSASVPGSECAGRDDADDPEDEDDEAAGRTYGVSVIERNARVIKWLYGLRQDKDSARSANA